MNRLQKLLARWPVTTRLELAGALLVALALALAPGWPRWLGATGALLIVAGRRLARTAA
jgi:uncharacterized membrane protein